mmetsp:Transcript_3169/g.9813  ORF Transcript_3169/g.9813 Transcript_3169/m.9813 type:complete len:360 (+) Transcript_3169:129-1208(+)
MADSEDAQGLSLLRRRGHAPGLSPIRTASGGSARAQALTAAQGEGAAGGSAAGRRALAVAGARAMGSGGVPLLQRVRQRGAERRRREQARGEGGAVSPLSALSTPPVGERAGSGSGSWFGREWASALHDEPPYSPGGDSGTAARERGGSVGSHPSGAAVPPPAAAAAAAAATHLPGSSTGHRLVRDVLVRHSRSASSASALSEASSEARTVSPPHSPTERAAYTHRQHMWGGGGGGSSSRHAEVRVPPPPAAAALGQPLRTRTPASVSQVLGAVSAAFEAGRQGQVSTQTTREGVRHPPTTRAPAAAAAAAAGSEGGRARGRARRGSEPSVSALRLRESEWLSRRAAAVKDDSRAAGEQ